MTFASAATWLLPAVLLFWAVGAYNRLVRLRATALQAFGALDNSYAQHVLLLANPPAEAALSPQLRAAGSQFGVALAVARARPLQRETLAALCTARDVVAACWADLREPDPALAARWHAALKQQADAVQRFNEAAQAYGRAVTAFPALLIAALFGLKPARTV